MVKEGIVMLISCIEPVVDPGFLSGLGLEGAERMYVGSLSSGSANAGFFFLDLCDNKWNFVDVPPVLNSL